MLGLQIWKFFFHKHFLWHEQHVVKFHFRAKNASLNVNRRQSKIRSLHKYGVLWIHWCVVYCNFKLGTLIQSTVLTKLLAPFVVDLVFCLQKKLYLAQVSINRELNWSYWSNVALSFLQISRNISGNILHRAFVWNDFRNVIPEIIVCQFRVIIFSEWYFIKLPKIDRLQVWAP